MIDLGEETVDGEDVDRSGTYGRMGRGRERNYGDGDDAMRKGRERRGKAGEREREKWPGRQRHVRV